MPEGPQVRRAADLIARHVGAVLTAVAGPPSRTPWELALPQKIVQVDAHGKNLFITLENGTVIYNHMLMWGSWRDGCEWHGPKPKRLNTCFTTTRGQLGYFGGGVLKAINSQEADQLRARLGPDILRVTTPVEAFARVRESRLPIGEALLSQELVAGIGNIYKSEALFAAGLNPRLSANRVSEASYERLFRFLQPQMTADVRRAGAITTTPPNLRKRKIRNFVYRRYHQPCLFCSTSIERIYQGRLPRSTYFCPRCQA